MFVRVAWYVPQARTVHLSIAYKCNGRNRNENASNSKPRTLLTGCYLLIVWVYGSALFSI